MSKPRFNTGGWGTPKIDLGGCVLYLPLWRPDMVARGGGIKNGTGTLDVSPQNLAVGANTITATGAGTFIITVPQAGTCASGTATITGSPVTLNAGVATTVSTGATTGTFTVTTSNIIRSKDTYGHLCTVTGALWTPQGRSFDGVDDKILAPSIFAAGASFTILGWFKSTLAQDTRAVIVNCEPGDGTKQGIGFGYQLGQSAFQVVYDGVAWGDGTFNPTLNQWYFYWMTRQGNISNLYKDSESAAISTLNNAVQEDSGTKISLGMGVDTAGADLAPWKGTIGEILGYDTIQSYNKAQQIRLATQWRYR